MCFIFRCYKWIINTDNVSNHGFESMHANDEVQNYHFYLTCLLIHNVPWIIFFIMENLWKKLQKKNTFHEQLITRYDGLQDNITGITFELSLSPFLFPHGHGAYDGKMSIYEYVKFCMNTLFSPFTMCTNHIG